MDACSLRSEPLSVTIKDASSHCDKTRSQKATGRKIIVINTDQNETVQSHRTTKYYINSLMYGIQKYDFSKLNGSGR